MIEMIAIVSRDHDADQRSDDQQQHDQRGGQAELQLALAQVARRQFREVAIERVAAGDVRREPPLPSVR